MVTGGVLLPQGSSICRSLRLDRSVPIYVRGPSHTFFSALTLCERTLSPHRRPPPNVTLPVTLLFFPVALLAPGLTGVASPVTAPLTLSTPATPASVLLLRHIFLPQGLCAYWSCCLQALLQICVTFSRTSSVTSSVRPSPITLFPFLSFPFFPSQQLAPSDVFIYCLECPLLDCDAMKAGFLPVLFSVVS